MMVLKTFFRIFSALLLVLVSLTTLFYSHLQLSKEKPTHQLQRADCVGPEFDIIVRIGKDVLLPSVCQNATCKSAYARHLQRVKHYPIPAVRHLLWRNESVSQYFAHQLRTWQNIHPNWTVVLWRDEDLKPFVRKYFPGAFKRFLELAPHTVMQVDMIRYMLLFKFGGVYADLDYKLASSLDEYRRFYAVVTREPEAHSLQYFGIQWPPRPMASPAFFMSAPGHAFYRFCIQHLQIVPYATDQPLSFAGPLGLTEMLEAYSRSFPVANSPLETVYMPPSYSFYPYAGNRLESTNSNHLSTRLHELKKLCKKISAASAAELRQYCRDVNNMDSITDSSQPVVAMHDLQKVGSIFDRFGSDHYLLNLTNIRSVISNLRLGSDLI